MVGDAAHGCPLVQPALLAGQGHIQLLGRGDGVVKEHFIKISQPVKQNTVFIFLFVFT